MIELWDFGEPWNRIRDAVLMIGSGGSSWPTGNEDQIRQLADEWRVLAAQLSTGFTSANTAAASLQAAWQGGSGAEFAQVWQDVGVKLPGQLSGVIDSVIASIDQAAMEIEHNKLSMLVEVQVLLLEIFVYAVMAWVALAAAMAAAATRIGVTRLTVQQIFRLLVSRAAESFAERGVIETLVAVLRAWRKGALLDMLREFANEAGVDVAATIGQSAMGHTDINVTRTLAAGAGGLGGGLASVLSPIGRNIAHRAANPALRAVLHAGGEILEEIGEETAGQTAGTWVATGKLTVTAPGPSQIAFGVARNKISGGARLGQRFADGVRTVAGVETRAQRFTREAEAAARASQRAAEEAAQRAEAAAATAARRAAAATEAANAARAAATRHAGGDGSTPTPTSIRTPTGNPTPTGTPTLTGAPTQTGTSTPAARQAEAAAGSAEAARVLAQRSANAAAGAATAARQAAQNAAHAAAAVGQATTPAEAIEAVRSADAAGVEAARAEMIASLHAELAGGEQPGDQPSAAPAHVGATTPPGPGAPSGTSAQPGSAPAPPSGAQPTSGAQPISNAQPASAAPSAPGTPQGPAAPATSPTPSGSGLASGVGPAADAGLPPAAQNQADGATPPAQRPSPPAPMAGPYPGVTPGAAVPPGAGAPAWDAGLRPPPSRPGARPTAATMSSTDVTNVDGQPAPADMSTMDGRSALTDTTQADGVSILASGPAVGSRPGWAAATPADGVRILDSGSVVDGRPGWASATPADGVRILTSGSVVDGRPGWADTLVDGRPVMAPVDVGGRLAEGAVLLGGGVRAEDILLGGGVPWERYRANHIDGPHAMHTAQLEELLRRPDGTFEVHPDPTGLWVAYLNGPGPLNGGRDINCGETAPAAVSTWYGVPTVAGVNRLGIFTDRSAIERWLRGRFAMFALGEAGLAQLEDQVGEAGHGAAALVSLAYSYTRVGHLLSLVNYRGTLYWIEAQVFTAPLPQAPYHEYVTYTRAVVLDARGVPIRSARRWFVAATSPGLTRPSPVPGQTLGSLNPPDPDSEPELNSEPESVLGPEPEPESEPASDSGSGSGFGSGSGSDYGSDSEPEPEPEPGPGPEPESESESESEPAPEPAPAAMRTQTLDAALRAVERELSHPGIDALTAVREFVSTLDTAARALEQRAELHRAVQVEQQAVVQSGLNVADRQRRTTNDVWRERRVQVALDGVAKANENAQRHGRIAGEYAAAAELAQQARDNYATIEADLARAGADGSAGAVWTGPTPELARQAYQDFRAALAGVRPTPLALTTTTSMTDLPQIPELADAITAGLRVLGVDMAVAPLDLHRRVRARLREVIGAGGEVFRFGSDVEVQLRFVSDDAVEVVEATPTGVIMNENMLGQLSQTILGPANVHEAATRSFNWAVTLPIPTLLRLAARAGLARHGMDWMMDHVPDRMTFDPARAIANVRWGRGRRWSVRGGGGNAATNGAVIDNRSESTYFEVTGRWEISFRTPDTRRAANGDNRQAWTPPVIVSTPAGRPTLRLAVSHPFTEPAPVDTRRLPPDAPHTGFPEHFTTGLNGLGDLHDTTVDMLDSGREHADVRPQLHAIFTDVPTQLRQIFNDPEGMVRLVHVGGRPYLVQVRGELVRDSSGAIVAELVGPASLEQWIEKLLVDYSTTSGSTSAGRTFSVTGEGGVGGSTRSALRSLPGDDGSLSYTGGSVIDEGTSMSAENSDIRPEVRRDTRHTQGYNLRAVLRTTVIELDSGQTLTTDPVPVNGFFQLVESMAFAAGLPVAAEALNVNESGEVLGHRDDPDPQPPPGRTASLPGWVGPDGVPGKGPGLVRDLTNIDRARALVIAALVDRGLLLPLDAHGRPDLTGVPLLDRTHLVESWDRTYLVENWLNVLGALSPDRIIAAYDQATQAGITVRLDRLTATGRVTHTMVIHLEQVGAEYEGHTDREPIVILNIGSGSSNVTESRSRTVARGPAGRASSEPEGLDLAAGGLDLRRTGGVTTSASAGSSINQVSLFESNEPGAIFRVSHRLRVELLTDGDPYSLLEDHPVEGTLILPVDMLPSSDPTATAPAVGIGPPSEALLRGSMLVHVDTRGLWEAAQAVLPRASRPGTAAHAVLREYVGVRRLLSNPEFLYQSIPIDYLVGAGPWPGSRSSLNLAVRPGPAELLGVIRAIVGDINLTLHSQAVGHSRSEGRSRSGSLTASDPSDEGTSDEGAWHQDRAPALSGGSNTTASTTTTSIAGRETLGIHTGLAYLVRVPYAVRLTGTEDGLFGPTTNREEVPGLSAVLALPEDLALRLYGRGEIPVSTDAVVDALRRYAESSLHLDRLTAIRVLERFLTERANAGETVEAIDSDPDLTRLLADHLIKAFPDVTLPPGLPPPPMDIVRHIIQHRTRHIIEHGIDLPAVVGELAERRMPGHMRGGNGSVILEDIVIDGRHGDVPLLNAVLEQVERVYPGVLDAVPALRTHLTNQFLGDRSQVGYPDMTEPRGLELTVPLPPPLPRLRHRLVPGRDQSTEVLAIGLRLIETNDPVVTGQNSDQGQITQDYRYRGMTRALARVIIWGGNLTGAAQPHHDGTLPTAGGGIGPGSQDTGSVAATETDMRRRGQFTGVDRLRQEFLLEITTEVRRTPYGVRRAARTAAAVVRRRPRTSVITISETAGYSGSVTLVVPSGVLAQMPAQATVAGPVALPHKYFVNRVDSGILYDVIHAQVEEWGLLDSRSGVLNGPRLSRALSQLDHRANLPDFATDEGHVLVTLVDFRVPGRFAEVRLRVSFSDAHRNAAVNENAEIGEVSRLERIAKIVRGFTHSATDTHSVNDPLAGSGVGRDGAGTAAVTVSGDRAAGERTETSNFERGPVGGIGVTVTYDITVTSYYEEPGGQRIVIRETSLPAVTGTAAVELFDHAIPGHQPAPEGTPLPDGDNGEQVEGVIAAALAVEQHVTVDPTVVAAGETPVLVPDRGYDLRGIDPMDIVPDNASIRVLKPDPNGGAQYGLEFKWINQNGQTVRLRVHGPDGTAPAGSNAASGDSYRVQIGARYQDIEGNLHPRNVHNPNSPYYDPTAANDTHIPWPSQYPGL